MDRRSWLWRRKSSEKSPGETESSGSASASGSLSSPSERFSDEQQAYSIHNTQSPEVTSKAPPHEEDANDTVKILTEKLSAALATINVKEELVKQHGKVAEEAVTGWEKAEKEVVDLKQQLDEATQKNSLLEDRVVHLDGALKECLRQLRQVREEQDQKVQEAITKKSQNTDSKSSELESQLASLRAQLETANSKAQVASSSESDLRLRLELAKKENATLQLELHSRLEELEIRTLERDLSTKTAETASKQHLESIKRVAKLEAECRRLKTMLRKAASLNDHKPSIASSSHGESLTDSQSDGGEKLTECGMSHSDTWASSLVSELDQSKVDKAPSKNSNAPLPEINLMDDFLEMERLASQPVRENKSRSPGSVTSFDKHDGNSEASIKAELGAMINRTAELEDKIEMMETEKAELSLRLNQSQDQLKLTEARLGQLQGQFNECQNQLKVSQAQLRDTNKKMGMLQAELDLTNELRQAIELELEDANVRKEEAESQLKAIEDESKILLSKVGSVEGAAERERSLYAESSTKCRALEEELSRVKCEVDKLQSQVASINDSKEAVEQELWRTNAMKEAAESQLKSVQAEAKSLLAKVSSLENETEKERQLSEEFATRCGKLESELARMKHETETWQSRLASVNDSKEAVELELTTTNARRQEAESQLTVVQAEAKSLLAKVGSLEQEADKERALSAEFAAKCRKLESELSTLKAEAGLSLAPLSKEELKIQQEKEMAVAASKLADCQKTIASLGKQLKSLASLEDLFLDSDKLLEVSEKDSQLPQNIAKPASSPSSNRQVKSVALSSETVSISSTGSRKDYGKFAKDSKEGLSSLTLDKSQKNGFGKLFPRSKSAMRSRNS